MMPCSPGVRPVAMEVRAVDVVDGATVDTGPPWSTDVSVGAMAARSRSWFQPRPSRVSSTADRSISATGVGTQSGTSSRGDCTAAATLVTHGPE